MLTHWNKIVGVVVMLYFKQAIALEQGDGLPIMSTDVSINYEIPLTEEFHLQKPLNVESIVVDLIGEGCLTADLNIVVKEKASDPWVELRHFVGNRYDMGVIRTSFSVSNIRATFRQAYYKNLRCKYNLSYLPEVEPPPYGTPTNPTEY